MTQANGTASIEKIAMSIDIDHLGVQAVKESIYSAIRSRCSELEGFNNKIPPIFENKAGVLTLLDFPERPLTGLEHELKFKEPHLKQALSALEGVLKARLGLRYAEWSKKSCDEKWHRIAKIEEFRNFFAEIAENNRRLFAK
jgi:hypothetical protein